jgi:hypothetical protein
VVELGSHTVVDQEQNLEWHTGIDQFEEVLGRNLGVQNNFEGLQAEIVRMLAGHCVDFEHNLEGRVVEVDTADCQAFAARKVLAERSLGMSRLVEE